MATAYSRQEKIIWAKLFAVIERVERLEKAIGLSAAGARVSVDPTASSAVSVSGQPSVPVPPGTVSAELVSSDVEKLDG